MPERMYGVGRYRYAAGTWMIWSIPAALLMFIIGGVHWIAAHWPYLGSLLRWLVIAVLALIAYGWLWWKARRR